MQCDEPINFLHLSTAVKIFCGSSIKLDMLPHVEMLLQEYLLKYKRLYCVDALKPNFHWAVHLRQQILDYGPVYNFWAFLSEHLNKVLKSSNSNNWTGGQIEISMMRKFAHGAQIDSLACDAIANAESLIVKMLLEHMLGDGHKASGTIQDAATGTGFDSTFHVIHFLTNSLIFDFSLDDAAQVALYTHYNSQQPHSVHYALEANPRPGSSQLNDFALYYQFTLLDGRRISPLARSTQESARSSLIKVTYMDKSWYGEVINIFSHIQLGIANGTRLLTELRWMIELLLVPIEDDPWSKFPKLDIMCFKLNEYWSPGKDGAPPTVLPFDQITSQIAHGIIKTSNPELWITTTLDRVCPKCSLSYND
ncbi:uncharacterized protein BJ212DRAFT_1289663 [Suillus subaureus]|uniref:Uncharacterized protein n=1 Tax=Suillus subaureus TaxID=48587 RepID=A0A9P7DL77_9AGAM|nr:uncharacterized protein BJ212DRAFT_1289663 [Suillus subaureus]KAG1797568.1 hypothetical protein BJ212DRAFT_1289663 [Suillus subaureus]